MLEEASSWYNSMQIRFQKRTTHHISFEGNYTISKLTDNSSAGRNNWVGSLANGLPQQLDRLYLEHSISANDAPQRLAAAVVVELPVGRNEWIGSGMNRGLNAVVGGWSMATLITEQSGPTDSDQHEQSAAGEWQPAPECGLLPAQDRSQYERRRSELGGELRGRRKRGRAGGFVY